MLRIKNVATEALRDEVYALRYRAYRKEHAIDASPMESFQDQYDSQPNHILWALTENEKVVGSIRTTWYENGSPYKIPEFEAYPDEIKRVVPSHARIVSANRFVVDPDRAEKGAQYAMLILRHYMVVAHSKADWSIAAARINHVPFYRRVMRLKQVSDGRRYPGLHCAMHLMACDFHQNIHAVYENNPVLKPRGYERMLLDESYRDIWEAGLPVEVV